MGYHVWKEFYLEGQAFSRPAISAPTDQPAGKKVEYSFGNEKTISSLWIQEEGQWKLAEYSSIKQAAQEKKQARKKRIYFDLENPYFFSASGGYLRGLAYPFNGFNLDLGFSYDFFSMGIFVEKGHLAAEKQGVSADESFFLFGANPQIQVPMILGDFLIDVFLQGRFVLCTGDGGQNQTFPF